MYRYHRILYRRLLRSQSSLELRRLREQSGLFPSLSRLIDEEMDRRTGDLQTVRPAEPSVRGLAGVRSALNRM